MANSLQDQLLKAGLITEEKAEDAKKAQTNKPRSNRGQSNWGKQSASADARKASPAKKKKNKRPPSDLAQFYKQRSDQERKEQEEAQRLKREQAKLKKERRKKIRKLVLEHLKNDEAAELRYNFIVGSTVKYVFVTEAQQKQLAEGTLSITFVDGKRCLIPTEIVPQIREIDPKKIVVTAEPETEDAESLITNSND